MIATKRRIKLVLQIDSDGVGHRAWFRVIAIRKSKIAAQRIAIQKRRAGWLARVDLHCGHYLVAVRKPRKREPVSWQLRIN